MHVAQLLDPCPTIRTSHCHLQMDVDEAEETRSRKSRATTAARTARRSEWNEDVFSGAIHSFRRWLGSTCAAS